MITHVDDPSYWDKRYLEDNAGWDLKTPSPIFISLTNKQEFIYPADLLIPGCGKGYDAVFAAERGYNVTAVDFSEQALLFGRKLAQDKGVKVNFLNRDIFTLNNESNFDFIFEYTTYCAINPARRREYAEKLASYLRPGGKLIALLFPIGNKTGGPPYDIDPIETYKIFSAYLKLEFFSRNIESIKPRKGREILHIYKK